MRRKSGIIRIKHDEKESTSIGTRQIAVGDLAERFPQCSGTAGILFTEKLVDDIAETQNIMLRGNGEREMEYGFGVAGLNGYHQKICDKF